LADTWLLDWPAAEKAGAAVVGGKGWNLGRLHRYGFPVPAGGVLAANAYLRFMETAPLPDWRAALASVQPEEAADPVVADKLEKLRAALRATVVPRAMAEAVQAFLAATGLDQVPLAVRSSATVEDGATASFAGIHQSILNVRGPQAVLEAIKECYASLWTPQALAYRRRLKLEDAAVACAVVLCAMVGGPNGAPKAAGVAFTCDPRTGRREELTISAVAGLGDALVSGRVNPEEITVEPIRTILRVTRRGQGIGRVLTDAEALRLARLVWRVGWALGDGQEPQDVEWAYDGKRFWIVQARPVTRLPHVTFPEIAALPVVWSNANLGEVIPGVPSTLTWSLLQTILRAILFAALEAVGYRLPRGMEVVRRFSGRLYFDLSALQWAFYDGFGLRPADVNRGLGGHQPEIPVPPGKPFRGRAGWRRLRTLVALLGQFFQVGRTHPRELARIRTEARRLKTLHLARLPNAGLLALWGHIRFQWDMGQKFQLANAAAGGWQAMFFNLLSWRFPDRGMALATALLAGGGGVTTAEQGYRLYDLAATARKDSAAREWLGRMPCDPHGWQHLPDDSLFRAEMAAFLDEFGHRAVYETDMANPRWNEDPSYLLDQVRYLLATEPGTSPRQAAQERRQAAEAEITRRTWLLRPFIHWLAGRARKGAALRECSRSSLVSMWEPTRKVILETGRRLVASGALDEPKDVFHLTWIDLEAFLLGEWEGAGARQLVADRKERDARWRQEEPPPVLILDGAGQPALLPTAAASIPPHSAPSSSPSSRVLTGVGVAAGRASGPARLLRHPSEGERLRPGDVLVAPSTDPGWTPLFLRASALVMEVGGHLSHGAIVAREYGIPAVVNVPRLFGMIRENQRLLVDGDAGRVELLGENQ
jgi:pyruvate,water dikinase